MTVSCVEPIPDRKPSSEKCSSGCGQNYRKVWGIGVYLNVLYIKIKKVTNGSFYQPKYDEYFTFNVLKMITVKDFNNSYSAK